MHSGGDQRLWFIFMCTCIFNVLPETIRYNEPAIRQNAAVLEYCRTSMCGLSGATAGILGLTGLYGFFFYFISSFVLSVRITVFIQLCVELSTGLMETVVDISESRFNWLWLLKSKDMAMLIIMKLNHHNMIVGKVFCTSFQSTCQDLSERSTSGKLVENTFLLFTWLYLNFIIIVVPKYNYQSNALY